MYSDELLQQAHGWALKKGVPKDVLEGAEYPDDIYQRVFRWQWYQQLEENDKKRVAEGLETLRNKIIHGIGE